MFGKLFGWGKQSGQSPMDLLKPKLMELDAELIQKWRALHQASSETDELELDRKAIAFRAEVLKGLKRKIPRIKVANHYVLKFQEGIVRRSNTHSEDQIRATFERLKPRYGGADYTKFD